MPISPVRIVLKALLIVIVLNLAFAAINPHVGRLSIYNGLVRGRERFPRGGYDDAYNLGPQDLDATVAAHVISSRKAPNEYRVVILGDSSTWGPLLAPSETMTGRLNSKRLSACGKSIRFFNLGYPDPSALKDFIILSRARHLQPDLVVWMLARESFTIGKLPTLYGAESTDQLHALFEQYGLSRYDEYLLPSPSLLDKTIFGQRRRLKRLILLQADGPLWDATGRDYQKFTYQPAIQVLDPIPSEPQPSSNNPASVPSTRRAFPVLDAAHRMIGDLPVLLVNEPRYLGLKKGNTNTAAASNLRKKYDDFRVQLQYYATLNNWSYVDLHDLVLPEDFTNNVFHLNASGEAKLARALSAKVLSVACP